MVKSMISSFKINISSFLSRSANWFLSVALLSFLVISVMGWLFIQHDKAQKSSLNHLEDFRLARLDLINGFLHISLSDSHNSPFGKAEGIALLDQAVSSFEKSLSNLEIPSHESSDEFRKSVTNFKDLLTRWKRKDPVGHAETVKLRIAFDNLVRIARDMDTMTQNRIKGLSNRINKRLEISFILAALMLSSICVLVSYAAKTSERFEVASKEIEHRFQEAMEATQGGLWDWNIKTDDVYYSPGYWKMLGYAPHTFVGNSESWAALLHPDDRERVISINRDCIENRCDTFELESRIKAKDGSWKWIFSKGKALGRDEKGMATRMIGTHTDISDRKKLEIQLQQSQKMEAVGRLAGGVAHDFNNMLGVILGNVDLAMDTMDSGDFPKDEIVQIRKAAEHSVDLTRQLLAFARKQTIAPKVLDLNSTVEGMLKMLRRLIGEGIDLAWVPSTKLWPVKIDPVQVDQILANLCVNAKDSIKDVGFITIETGNTTFDESYCSEHPGFITGEYAFIALSDNGCGMSKETINHIFEPFFTTKGTGQGTGLGLSTVYGIVKQNMGFINVYSEPGSGTTFRIFFPRIQDTVTDTENQALASDIPMSRGETVLLVEDEPTLLKLTNKILQSYGYNVLFTDSPPEAIQMAQKHQGNIDLLITDVVMPSMNCKELTDRIKVIRPDIPCLYMSGYTANVIAHHGVLDEGVQFIQKPFSKKDLARKVNAIITINRQKSTIPGS